MAASATRPLPDHGTTTRATRVRGHRRGCNCPGCHRRVNRYKKRRILAQHRGTWQPLTDAAPHLAILHDHHGAAWTTTQMAAVSGLDYKLVRILLGNDTVITAPTQLRASTVTALRRIVGADRLDPAVPDSALIDATGSRRRIQALAAIGWPQDALAGRTGRLKDIAHVERVTAGTARRIAAAYQELSTRPGPSSSAAIRARNKGWAMPAGFEDLDIDDPRTVPHDLTSRGRTPEELVEDADFIRDTTGADWSDVAERLGVHVNVLHTYRTRARERAAANTGSDA